ncbi:adenylate kinase 1 [Plasmodium gonderi]|uniref:Adenylate kinase 1 n=1 Tax=Plasmodium gonderi TaxID=77519 RepID=A0A1Y1JEL7_PLAGO|nr:adenylate kinase 1 [Plasmodium gonderi]GAW79775.1 adenylate kinase 1 [Plasmodium gonderi]
MKIVLFGAPGVGKGTFAEILSKKEKLKHINIGNILREEIKKESCVGREVKKIVTSGNLVNDDLIINIVKDEINKTIIKGYNNFKGFILDGFPRNIYQSSELVKITDIDLFVNIHLPKHILIKKLSGRRICAQCNNNFNVADIRDNNYDMPPILPSTECKICNGNANLLKRSDDNNEIIAHRLDSYQSTNLPIINFFKNLNCNVLHFDIKRGIKDFDNFYNTIVKHF